MSEIIVKTQFFDTIPTLMAYKGSLQRAAQNGCILLYHGLTACKEAQFKELQSLAETGFLSIVVDNVGHGARRYPDFDTLISPENPQVEENFLEMVQLTAKEVPQIVDALEAESLIDPNKLGIAGISMGGYITYLALLKEPRITAAAPIVGSPQWKIEHPQSPHHFIEKFYPIALLSQTATHDDVVPTHFTRAFHKKLEPYYHSSPERQQYIEFPNSGHFMRPEDWDACWNNLLQWFQRFFNAPTPQRSIK